MYTVANDEKIHMYTMANDEKIHMYTMANDEKIHMYTMANDEKIHMYTILVRYFLSSMKSTFSSYLQLLSQKACLHTSGAHSAFQCIYTLSISLYCIIGMDAQI